MFHPMVDYFEGSSVSKGTLRKKMGTLHFERKASLYTLGKRNNKAGAVPRTATLQLQRYQPHTNSMPCCTTI